MKRLVCVSLLGISFLAVAAAAAEPPWRLFGRRPVPMPAPLGTYVNGWHDAQTAAAEADQFVIYRQEWYLDGTKPGPYGSYHLQRISQRLPNVPFQVLIEADLRGEKINRDRQTYVVNELLAAGITDAQSRVVIGFPRAEGLYGDEAARIFLQRYSSGPGGSAGTSGLGGSSSGGIGITGGGLMGCIRGY